MMMPPRPFLFKLFLQLQTSNPTDSPFRPSDIFSLTHYDPMMQLDLPNVVDGMEDTIGHQPKEMKEETPRGRQCVQGQWVTGI